jgi:N-methylhydantoinase A/oxoprolinase/acetone carboxylase beta subunit
MPVPEILRQLGLLHVGQLGAQELFQQEILGKSGLTPTDLMHVEGKYEQWDVEAAKAAVTVLAKHLYIDQNELRQQIWDQINEMTVHAILVFLSEKQLDPPGSRRIGPTGQVERHRGLSDDEKMAHWFFNNSLYSNHPYLDTRIKLTLPVVGIGAPAAIMLKSAARSLNTELILPEHHAVANAVGAIAGSVMVSEELLVYPILDAEGVDVRGYTVQASDERHEFEEMEDALELARRLGRERAFGAAIRSGADNPQVTLEELSDGLDTFRIRVKAVGNPRLTR